jgi:MFS family permease
MVDLAVNGSYWLGAAIGAGLTILFLDQALFDVDAGWRFPFGIASVLGVFIIIMRLYLPESPRWLILHGRIQEAEELVLSIEARVLASTGKELELVTDYVVVHDRLSDGYLVAIGRLFTVYWKRAVLGLSLMIAQAFFYNAIFFTYPLILKDFYGVEADRIGIYEIPFCIGSSFSAPELLKDLSSQP